jgi:uncharacterized repeat protein (TIGR02543 family)
LFFLACNSGSQQSGEYKLSVSADPPNGGDVEGSSETTTYAKGAEVVLSATPRPGYVFTGWQGDVAGTDLEMRITMKGDMKAEAVFSLDRQCSRKWLLLIHFGVDNNIDYAFGVVSNYLAVLESIEAADVSDRLEIVVLLDGYNGDETGYASSFQDGYYHLSGGDIHDDLVVAKDEINSGAVEDTRDFVDWALENWPAGHIYYSIFNHGGGFDDENIEGTFTPEETSLSDREGIAFDDHSSDSLTHHELNAILRHIKTSTGRKVDLFHTFACLMGGIELAYEIKNNARYILFSEEVFPAGDWSYEPLALLNEDTSASPKDLGIEFVNSCYEHYTSEQIAQVTLTLIDLRRMGALYNAVDALARRMIEQINADPAIAGIFNRIALDTYSMYTWYSGFIDFYYIDLGDFAKRIRSEPGMPLPVQEAAGRVLDRMDQAIVDFFQVLYPETTGLSIFHNIWNDSWFKYDIELYASILKFASNAWVDYLKTMESLTPTVEPDGYEPDDDFSAATPLLVGEAPQVHTIHDGSDMDYFSMVFEAGVFYRIAVGPGSSMDLDLYNQEFNRIRYTFGGVQPLSEISFYCETSGTYYVGVRCILPGTYSIRLTTIPVPMADGYEPDNSMETAGTIVADEPAQEHTFHTMEDEDYLRVDLTAGKTYRIQTHYLSILTGTVIILYDSENNIIKCDIGWYPPVNFECETSGTYFIRIENQSNDDLGDYSIAVVTEKAD